MPLTYVIADLHGRFDLLEKALNAIGPHANGLDFKIITLGDYVDRGPASCAIIVTLRTFCDGKQMICLKGNHEAMMVETIRKPLDPGWWIFNGGGDTLVSYGHPRKCNELDMSVVPEAHLEWLDKLPIMHVDEHRVYCHAWVDSSVPLDKQDPDKVMWTIYPHHARYGHRLTGRHVVHGHHQHEDGPKLYPGRTNLDTGAWYTGRLVVGVFDDEKPGGPIDTIEIKGEPHE